MHDLFTLRRKKFVKLLVVGDSGLGKTTLIRSLVSTPGERLQVSWDSQTPLPMNLLHTIWVQAYVHAIRLSAIRDSPQPPNGNTQNPYIPSLLISTHSCRLLVRFMTVASHRQPSL